jgi:hypothetical protein
MKEILKSNIKALQNLFATSKPEGIVDVNFKVASVYFELKYKEMPIGTLEFKDNCWLFTYCEAFKNQHEIAPIVSFPDVNTVYKSENLWSFFTSRIPDVVNSSSTLKEEKNNDNYVQQLKTYGRKSITNPFDLLAVNI